MPFARRGSAELYYETHGDGPPVVFAHGAGGNTLIWWQQVRAFSARHRVLVFDHRGFGRSRCAPGEFDAGHFPEDLLSILDAERIDRAALVCQSMGGFTGLRFAVSHPERVSAIVLAGTAGGADTPMVEADRRRIVERMPTTPRLERVLARRFIRRDPARAELYAQINGLNRADATDTILQSLWRERVSPEQLAALRVPVLILVGTEDWFFRVETLSDLAERIPGARLQVLEGIGHSSYFEAPEEFNRLVGEFLAGAEASSRAAA